MADKLKECISFLENVVNNTELLAQFPEDQRIKLLTAAGKLSRPDREELKRRKKEHKVVKRKNIVQKERKARSQTGIRKAREDAVFTAPLQISEQSEDFKYKEKELNSPRNCYICKAEYTKLHFFYDSMCSVCADLNYKKRFQTASLHGKAAIITGARVKIGYQAALMMLTAGAKVIVTTRFPIDAALRFSKEKDFHVWKDRLQIYGLDLRHTPSIELFVKHIEQTNNRLDILINNAAQTVRRPPGFYAHLLKNETKDYDELPHNMQNILRNYRDCLNQIGVTSVKELPDNSSSLPTTEKKQILGVGLRSSAALSQIPNAHELSIEKVFPKDKLDVDLQQVDLRDTNSWRLKLGEIETVEMIEIQLVNAIAPFVLCNKLAGMMKKDYTGQKHMVNVTAMEGKFLRFKTNGRHPHTNMAKAALNMLTHTCASDFAKYGIFINAVDTGWVTDEDPAVLAKLKQDKHDFQPPLDIVDGAARICDPFFNGILTEKHWCGKFLKDYFPIDW